MKKKKKFLLKKLNKQKDHKSVILSSCDLGSKILTGNDTPTTCYPDNSYFPALYNRSFTIPSYEATSFLLLHSNTPSEDLLYPYFLTFIGIISTLISLFCFSYSICCISKSYGFR